MPQASSLNCLPLRNPYQTPHSLNASLLGTERPLFFTEKCFVASPSQKSAPIETFSGWGDLGYRWPSKGGSKRPLPRKLRKKPGRKRAKNPKKLEKLVILDSFSSRFWLRGREAPGTPFQTFFRVSQEEAFVTPVDGQRYPWVGRLLSEVIDNTTDFNKGYEKYLYKTQRLHVFVA